MCLWLLSLSAWSPTHFESRTQIRLPHRCGIYRNKYGYRLLLRYPDGEKYSHDFDPAISALRPDHESSAITYPLERLGLTPGNTNDMHFFRPGQSCSGSEEGVICPTTANKSLILNLLLNQPSGLGRAL